MIYMGVDGSTTSTGIGIFDNEKLLYYECIKPKSKLLWQDRVMVIAQRLNAILDEYRPSVIYMEDVPLKDGKPTILKLGAVRGVVIGLCGIYNIKLDAESVSDWRRNAGFYGDGKEGLKRDEMKKKAVKEVKRLFNIDVNDDVAEGILIAYRTVYPKQSAFGRKAVI